MTADPDEQPPTGTPPNVARPWLEARARRIFVRTGGGAGARVCLADLEGEDRAFWLGWFCCRIAFGHPVYVLRES